MICLLEAWPAHLGAAVHPPGCSPQTRVTWAVFSLVASAQGRGHTLSSVPGKRSRHGPAEGPLPRAEQGTLLSRLLLPPQLQPLASCLPGASLCTQHKAAFILASRALTGLPRNATCAPSVWGPPDCGAGAGLSSWLQLADAPAGADGDRASLLPELPYRRAVWLVVQGCPQPHRPPEDRRRPEGQPSDAPGQSSPLSSHGDFVTPTPPWQ